MKHIIIIILITFFLSCENKNINLIRLNTNIPDVIPFIEEFNNSNNEIQILINSAFTKEECDIIIFRGHPQNSPYKTTDLSHLFDTEIQKKMFYDNLLNNVTEQSGEIRLLPISFDLSGLIYFKTDKNISSVIKIEDFLEDSESIFSPYWNKDFMIWYYLTYLPNFNIEDKYIDKKKLLSTTNTIKKYSITKNWDVDQFNKKYMHLSPELLVNQKTIDYYFYNLSNYIRYKNKKNISFSLLSSNGNIMTNDIITYIGVNEASKNKKNAEHIISWIFNKKNQSMIIENNFTRPELSTLFNGELSALKEVTEEILPKYYPTLKFLLPRNEVILPPQDLPRLWDSLKEQVLIPTIEQNKNSDNLIDNYEKYYNDWSKKHNK